MPNIAVVTDTNASLPPLIAEKYPIRQVPIIVQFGDESLRAVYDIDDLKTFARIDSTGKLPTTSAPSPGDFSKVFRAALESGVDGILCFTVSSEVSATYASAVAASNDFPGRDITVVDTRSLSMGQGFQVLYAAEVLSQGASKTEAIAAAKSVYERTHFFAALSTLKYLAMSGRVGHVAAGFANLLNVKPVLTIQNGKLELLERIRTQRKAWARLIELAQEKINAKTIERMAIAHVAAEESAREFEAMLRNSINCPDDIIYCELTPGLSVHSGAGLVGIGFVIK